MSKKESPIIFNLPSQKAYLLIAIISILVYSNTLMHGFVLDDTAVIENNKFVREGIKGIPQIFTTFYWQGFWNSNAGLYRPLSLIMFAIEYQLSPNNPVIHHLVNIALYAISCCLLYKVFIKLFDKINPLFFLLVTLLFVVNPLHTEVVANIKSRDEILALLFFLLCCDHLYIRAGKSKKYTVLISATFFLLSLLSKEGAIIFLPMIFLFDYFRERNILAIFKNRLNLIITSLIWLGWHQYVIHSSGPVIEYTRNDNSLVAAGFIEQKATALGMFARYIMKLVYPYQLSYDYSFNQIPVIGIYSPMAILGIVLLSVLVYFSIRFFKKDIMISTGIAFILLPLFLTGNLFFNIGATMADRFLFISSIGSSLLIGLFIFKLLKTDVMRHFSVGKVAAVFIPLLLIYTAKTFSRNADWKNNATLFAKDVTTVPNSARAHYNYGTALMNNAYKKNDQASAIREFQLCLQIDPLYYDALLNLGAVYTKQKEYSPALEAYRKAMRINNKDNMLYGNMGEAFYRSQQPDSAIVYFDKAHQLGNRIADSYNILGTIWFSKKEYEKACRVFEEGLKSDSTSAGLYMNYGNALAMSNRDHEAINALNKSYSLDPGNVQPLYFIALTYNKIGDTLNAGKYFNEYQKLKK